MATIYKRGGAANKGGTWYITFAVRPGVRRTVKGCKDRATTEALARKLETEAWQRRAGLVDPKADQYAKAEATPLMIMDDGGGVAGGHLADFHAALIAKGTTTEQADLVRSRTLKLIMMIKAKAISQLTPSAVQIKIAVLRDSEGRSLHTCNHYLRSVKQFTRWLWRDGRCREDALAHLSGYNVKLDRRHDRRALSDDEIARLIDAAQRGDAVLGMEGPTRAVLYRLAVETGLRAGELASLKPESFNLIKLHEATVTVAAAYSKHRRDDVLPLRADLAAVVAEFLKGKPRGTPLFPMPEKAARMVRHDLDAARKNWLEQARTEEERKRWSQSSFLASRDEANRVADFHALRHTFITRLAQSNVAPALAKSLARHSTITLTMDRYTHTVIGDQRQALEMLPKLGGQDHPGEQPQVLQVTGTDGAEPAKPSAPGAARRHQNPPRSATTRQDGKREGPPAKLPQVVVAVDSYDHLPSPAKNAPDRIRTCDPRFRKPVLYPTELRAQRGTTRNYYKKLA